MCLKIKTPMKTVHYYIYLICMFKTMKTHGPHFIIRMLETQSRENEAVYPMTLKTEQEPKGKMKMAGLIKKKKKQGFLYPSSVFTVGIPHC